MPIAIPPVARAAAARIISQGAPRLANPPEVAPFLAALT